MVIIFIIVAIKANLVVTISRRLQEVSVAELNGKIVYEVIPFQNGISHRNGNYQFKK